MRGKPGWWNHTEQKYWAESDWRDWERHGSPDIPRELRLGADDPLPLTPPVVMPPHLVPARFTLFPPKRTSRDTRGRAIDAILDKHLGGRRRR